MEDPDLIIDGIGVEVKSYETKTITLGKFGKDQDSINLLNQIFGVLNLFSKISPETKIVANTGNFTAQSALQAFKLMHELLENPDLRNVPITKPLFDRIDNIYKRLEIEDETSPERGTAKLLRKLLSTKLSKKPMMGKKKGYILNVGSNGEGTFYEISNRTTNAIADEDILNNGISVRSSEIQMNFPKLYGKLAAE